MPPVDQTHFFRQLFRQAPPVLFFFPSARLLFSYVSLSLRTRLIFLGDNVNLIKDSLIIDL